MPKTNLTHNNSGQVTAYGFMCGYPQVKESATKRKSMFLDAGNFYVTYFDGMQHFITEYYRLSDAVRYFHSLQI